MPKQVAPLTARSIDGLRAQPGKQIEASDGQVQGLRVRRNPSGTLSWSLHMRAVDGTRRRFDVGVGLGLAEARRQAEELRQRIRMGDDPTASRRLKRERARAAEKGEGTFGAIIADYFATGSGRVLSSKLEQERRIRDVFSAVLERPSIEVKLVDLQRLAERHASASSAARAVAYLMPVLKWGYRHQMVGGELRELEKPVERSESNVAGQRTLTKEEVAKILPVLGGDGYGLAARFILLTGCRRGEADGATWGEIDLDKATWTIAPERRKDTRSRIRKKQVATRPHIVPLSAQAVELLASIPRGASDELVFKNKAGGQLGNWQKWQVRINARSGVHDWDRHALRRTCATFAGELGAEPHVISALLGHRHIGSQLTSIYNKARYLPEHRAILEEIGNLVSRIDSNSSGLT